MTQADKMLIDFCGICGCIAFPGEFCCQNCNADLAKKEARITLEGDYEEGRRLYNISFGEGIV